MQHIFLPPEQFSDSIVRITGVDHQHLARVLRARVGEKIVVLDGTGNAFHAELVSIEKHESTAQIEAPLVISSESAIHLTIAQALGKGDKFEEVVQHGTEAGASAFLPLRAERCVVDVPAAKERDRIARWKQIAKSAAEQSKRALVPTVRQLVTSSELIAQASDSASEAGIPLFMLHTSEAAITLKAALQTLTKPEFLILAIGPEGGWSPKEILLAQKANLPLVSLGPRVLRTETAALVAISQIIYHFDV